MGSKNSKGSGRREFTSYGSASSSTYNQQYGYPPQTPYHQPSSYSYTPQHQHGPPPTSSSYGSQASYNYGSEIPVAQPHRKLDRKYSRIADNYRSLDEVRPICSMYVCDFLYYFKDHLFLCFVFFIWCLVWKFGTNKNCLCTLQSWNIKGEEVSRKFYMCYLYISMCMPDPKIFKHGQTSRIYSVWTGGDN